MAQIFNWNSKTVLGIVLFFVVIIIIGILSKLIAKKEDFPYKIRKSVMSNYEKKFFNKMIDRNIILFPKVRVIDIVSSTDKKMEHISKIASRSIDFLIIDADINLIGAILFKDSRKSNKIDFLSKMFTAINFPVFILPKHFTDADVDNIAIEINKLLKGGEKHE